jgi:hypothetical protein
MKVHIQEGDIHLLDLRTRMPFKYGIATMTHTPHALVRLRVLVADTPAVGLAADHLPPKWFTKDPARDVAGEVDEMARVIEHAVELARGVQADSPFAAWQAVHEAQARWGQEQGLPPLLTQFGTSLVERALIEAVCRQLGQPFHQVIRGDALGVRLGDIYAALTGLDLARFLPAAPLETIHARHTVGLADPLTDADIPEGQKLEDGLPQSLEACMQVYGLHQFKIKVTGDLSRDRERLLQLARLLAGQAPGDYLFSFDGNEQFREVGAFQHYWKDLHSDPGLAAFFTHLAFVEQPFHRDIALNPEAMAGLKGWSKRPPLIIDESDAEPTSMGQALALGYAGTSHKNCKGVFKTLANLALIHSLKQQAPGESFLLSGEDLANTGPVALLQDLAVCASLGIASVERNGHHYFAGLSQFPVEIQQEILAAHGDLYHASAAGWPTLTIHEGKIAVGSLNRAPFGVGPSVDPARFQTLAAWRQTRQHASPS